MVSQKKLALHLLLFLTAIITYSLFFFVFLHNNPCTLMYDAGHYHEGALGLLRHAAYVGYDGQALFYRLPGYSAFLATLYWITKEWIVGTLLLQLVLAATLPVLVRSVIHQLTASDQLSRHTAWLSVIAPAYMIFAGMLMSEILCTWLFLLFLILIMKMIKQSSGTNLPLAAGLILGLLSLVRPVGHLLLPFIITYLMIFMQTSWRQKIIANATFLAGWLMPAGSWLLRNFLLTGHLFFHTLPGHHFNNHVTVRLVAATENIPYKDAQEKVFYSIMQHHEALLQKKTGQPLQEIEFTKLYEQEALATIKRYPLQFLQLATINCLKTTFGLYSSELLMIDANGALPSYDRTGISNAIKRYVFPSTNNQWIPFVIYFEIFLLILSIIGALLAAIRYRKKLFSAQAVLIIGCLFFFIGISFACGYARLRMSVEIFYLLAAAYAVQEVLCWLNTSVSARWLLK